MLEKYVLPALTVLLPLGVGFLAGQINRSRPIFRALKGLLIWIILPIIVFGSITVWTFTSDIYAVASSAILACMALGVGAVLSAGVVYGAKMDRSEGVCVLMNSTFMNYTFLGLAVVYATLGVNGLAPAAIFAVAAGVIHLTIGFALTASVSVRGRVSAREIAYSFLTFPPAFALIIAMLFVGFEASPPGGLERMREVVDILAKPGIIGMLLVAGSQLSFANPRKHLRRLVPIGSIRLVACPLVIYGFIVLVGVREIVAQTTLIQATMPPGVFNLILAQKFELDMELYGAPVFYLTIFSLFLALPLVIFLGF